MRAILIAGALALLSGCGDSAGRRFTQGDYGRIDAADVNARNALAQIESLNSRVAALEAQNTSLRDQINGVRELGLENARNHESLRKTFNGNVDKDNLAKVARLTASGYCGAERVNFQDGSYTIRNRECTLKDLK